MAKQISDADLVRKIDLNVGAFILRYCTREQEQRCRALFDARILNAGDVKAYLLGAAIANLRK